MIDRSNILKWFTTTRFNSTGATPGDLFLICISEFSDVPLFGGDSLREWPTFMVWDHVRKTMEDFTPVRTEIKRGRDFIGVGVGAVIIDQNNQILLLMRRKAPEIEHWTIPGGTVEFGETVENAILRELEEEIGVPCTIERLLGVTNHILPAEQKHWVSPAFLCHIVSGVPENREPDAHSQMQWFPLDELPSKITLTTAKALDFYRNYLRQNNR